MKFLFIIFSTFLFFGMCHSEAAVVQFSDAAAIPVNAKDTIPPSVDPEDGDIMFTPYYPQPYFSGCEHIEDRNERKKCSDEKVVAFIYGNLKYPEEAKNEGVEGTVVIRFTVEKDGSLSFDEDMKKLSLGI